MCVKIKTGLAFVSVLTTTVIVNGTYSQWYRVESGISEGSILGPLLFLIYINDLFYLFIYLLHGLYRTLSHSQSEESQVRGGHKSVSEKPAVKFSF